MNRPNPVINRDTVPLLDADVLRTFVAIAECGSFTRAAKQVFRTPSALSMQIKRLEEILGHVLFVREARHVRLTPEGEVLLGYGRRLLRLNEEAIQQFLTPTLEGRVSLGTSDDIGNRILPGVLAQFARSYPAVQVDVVVGSSKQNLDRLDAGELDMALITVGNQGQEMRGEVVHTEPLVWAGREGGIAANRSPLPVALASHGCVWRRTALRALDEAGMAYRIAYTCDNCSGQEAAMFADLAVAPFPLSLVRPPLRKLDREGLPALADYQIALVRAGISPVNDALAGHVKEAFGDLRV
ncbi:LysR family transcriptional regulator [Marinobacter sp. NP-4(2019)]|uniref:LysR substrate-binding domain-containing protein n=1 Tax=Marinobacter sp. NP-4(2019) TaxID=2488665 RepID=UPI000FC3DE15|nr:LysR substrate-binding domain-containing protein [Marinobacter sp. NP-4(2019)]AZT82469.1 LysR family transcriptional regulator [Marinobacter sp. NP-4(2019)]